MHLVGAGGGIFDILESHPADAGRREAAPYLVFNRAQYTSLFAPRRREDVGGGVPFDLFRPGRGSIEILAPDRLRCSRGC